MSCDFEETRRTVTTKDAKTSMTEKNVRKE